MTIKRNVLDDVENVGSNAKKLKTSKPKSKIGTDTNSLINVNQSKDSKDKIVKLKKEKKHKSSDTLQIGKKNKVKKVQNTEVKNSKLEKGVSPRQTDNYHDSNKNNSQNNTESKHEMREKKKQLKTERQSKKKKETVYDLGVQAKNVWNKVRGDDCPEKDREKLLKELHTLVKGNLSKVSGY